MDVNSVAEKYQKQTDKTRKKLRQYLGLEELETTLKNDVADISIDLVVYKPTYSGQASAESKTGGRLSRDFGISSLNDTIKTLLLAEISKKKSEIEQYFEKLDEKMGDED